MSLQCSPFFDSNMGHILVCLAPTRVLVKIVSLAAQSPQPSLYFSTDQALHSHDKFTFLPMFHCPWKCCSPGVLPPPIATRISSSLVLSFGSFFCFHLRQWTDCRVAKALRIKESALACPLHSPQTIATFSHELLDVTMILCFRRLNLNLHRSASSALRKACTSV